MPAASTAVSGPASSAASVPRPPNGSRRSVSHWPVSYGAVGLIGRPGAVPATADERGISRHLHQLGGSGTSNGDCGGRPWPPRTGTPGWLPASTRTLRGPQGVQHQLRRHPGCRRHRRSARYGPDRRRQHPGQGAARRWPARRRCRCPAPRPRAGGARLPADHLGRAAEDAVDRRLRRGRLRPLSPSGRSIHVSPATAPEAGSACAHAPRPGRPPGSRPA